MACDRMMTVLEMCLCNTLKRQQLENATYRLRKYIENTRLRLEFFFSACALIDSPFTQFNLIKAINFL